MTDKSDQTDVGQVDEEVASSSDWFNQRRSFRYRFAKQLSKLSSGRIKSPYILSMEAYYRAKDAQENSECQPNSNQHFETWGIWAVEAYTPATIGKLIRSLEKLKPLARGEDRDPARWVREQRNNPGSSFELYLRPPNSSFRITGFGVELPEFVSSGAGTIWSATPSLTLLTMFFIPSIDERGRIERILRAHHPTRIEQHGTTGAGIFDPEIERRRLISEARADWSAQSSKWFTTHFPGLFSHDARGVPTCELTVADGLVPYSRGSVTSLDRKTLTALEWIDTTTFSPSNEPEGSFFYAPFSSWHKGATRYSIIATTRQAFEDQNVSGWGSDDDRFIYPLDRSFRPVIAQWAIPRVLSYYRDRIARTRDVLADVVGSRNVTRAVGRVRQQTAECADAAIVARDVVDSIANYSLRIYDAGLSLTKRRETDDDRRMDVALRETLTERGNTLVRDVEDLNTTLHAQAALLSAHANLRLQPWIILLAIVSTFAGAVAAITPAREVLGWQKPAAQVALPPKPLSSKERLSTSHTPPSAIHRQRAKKLGGQDHEDVGTRMLPATDRWRGAP